MSTSAIDKLLDSVEWVASGPAPERSDLPHVTHEGVLRVGELSLRVYQLSNGVRVIDPDDFARIFGGSEEARP